MAMMVSISHGTPAYRRLGRADEKTAKEWNQVPQFALQRQHAQGQVNQKRWRRCCLRRNCLMFCLRVTRRPDGDLRMLLTVTGRIQNECALYELHICTGAVAAFLYTVGVSLHLVCPVLVPGWCWYFLT